MCPLVITHLAKVGDISMISEYGRKLLSEDANYMTGMIIAAVAV